MLEDVGPLPAPNEYEQVLLYEQIICHQPTHATRPGQSCKHGNKVDQKDQETFHQGPE